MRSGSIDSGTASMLRRRLSERSFQVLTRMTAAMMRLTMGSMTFQPVRLMTIPEITTPTETRVSASMWRKAPRVLMSCLELRDSSHAQYEIRAYAIAIRQLIRPIVPHVMDYYDRKLAEAEAEA